MSRTVIDEALCKGCLLCTAVCPENILRQSNRMNPQGYKVVEAAPELLAKCTGCTACAQMCPDVAITVWRTRKVKKEAE
ncbi:MAG: 4Fe-4S dicluster domain-containing protein [Thermodesulfobacteriota bacterium]